MNQFLFLANIGGDLVQLAKETGLRFGVDWPHFIAQVISFLIVAGLLYKFAYQRILAVLQDRRDRIAESLANAEKIKAELSMTEAARQDILDRASSRANQLIEEARQAAAVVRERETQKAIAAAEQIIAKAREATTAEHAQMLLALKREVGRLVVQTTATITGKILTPEDQKRLAEEATRQLAA
jgi:F-type H+-transporting ATPase subunit b